MKCKLITAADVPKIISAGDVPEGQLGEIVGGEFVEDQFGWPVVGTRDSDGTRRCQVIGTDQQVKHFSTRIRLLRKGDTIVVTEE